jgi:hypothetical protein
LKCKNKQGRPTNYWRDLTRKILNMKNLLGFIIIKGLINEVMGYFS